MCDDRREITIEVKALTKGWLGTVARKRGVPKDELADELLRSGLANYEEATSS